MDGTEGDRGTDNRPRELRIKERLTFKQTGAFWEQLKSDVASAQRGDQLNFDMSAVEAIDGGSMALLVQMRADLHHRGVTSEFVGADDTVQKLIRLHRGDIAVGRRRRRRAQGALDQIGTATLAVADAFKNVFHFFGHTLISIFDVVSRPKTGNWRDLSSLMEKAGADAVPIVTLINFLVGFVMAFQGAVQLKPFGANIFVADLVGLSICRELGPLMTAIILCGRSGAAFTAELGSMKVSEEIDALTVIGISPMSYLVLPRILALVLVAPLLTLMGNAVGILGGLAVGVLNLDLTIVGYLTETKKAIELWDIYSGVIKSGAFAIVIGLIACQQGLATTGGAEGVGRRTTSAVVSILFALILVDAAFTIFFHAIHL